MAMGAGLTALGLFVIAESKCRNPLLPLGVLRVRTLQVAAAVTLAFYSCLYGILFLFSLNLIQVQGYDAALAGMTGLPLMLLLVLLSRWSGAWVDRRDARLPLTLGPTIAGAGFWWLGIPAITAGPRDFWANYLPALILLGVAMGVTVAPLSTAVMNSLSSDRAGLASGINSTLGRLSSVLAIAVFGSLALLCFSRSLLTRTATLSMTGEARARLATEAAKLADAEVPGGLIPETAAKIRESIKLAFVDSFRFVCWVCAGVVWASALLAGIMTHKALDAAPGV
jgi:hypothetical protein